MLELKYIYITGLLFLVVGLAVVLVLILVLVLDRAEISFRSRQLGFHMADIELFSGCIEPICAE